MAIHLPGRFTFALAAIVTTFALSLTPAALAQPARGQPTDLRVNFIDVGQGDAIWIKTPDTGEGSKHIVIDGGPDRGEQNRLTKYLATYGLKPGSAIDYLIVTHPHDDHYPALLDVLRLYQVRTIIDSGFPKAGEYEDFVRAAKAEKVGGRPAKFVPLRTTTGFTLPDLGGGVTARILHADSETLKNMGSGNTRENNASTAIRLAYGNISFLLMGDAEGKKRDESPERPRFVEGLLLATLKPEELRSTVLKAGHHGSETGSTLPFLRAVQPSVIVVMSGRRSFNGRMLPDETVLERYEQLPDVLIVRTDDRDEAEERTTKTDQDGDDIYMRTDGKTLRVYQALGPDGRRRWRRVR